MSSLASCPDQAEHEADCDGHARGLGLIKDAELLADKLRQWVMIKYAGPDPVSVIGKAPSARRLEAVHKKPAG